MATSEAKEIKKQETLVRFSIISYKTRLRVLNIYRIKCWKGGLLKNHYNNGFYPIMTKQSKGLRSHYIWRLY